MTSPEPQAELRRMTEAEVGASDRERFELELEFLQCLASPQYLNWLAQNRYFEDPAFLNYLKYLQYWKRQEYARFVIYPHALYFLDLVQVPEFRTAIASPAYKEMVHTQQFFFWQHFRDNRVKEMEQERQQQQQQAATVEPRQQQQQQQKEKEAGASTGQQQQHADAGAG